MSTGVYATAAGDAIWSASEQEIFNPGSSAWLRYLSFVLLIWKLLSFVGGHIPIAFFC